MNDTQTPVGFGVGFFTDQTNINPVGLVAVIIFGIYLLLAQRKYAFVPLLMMAVLIPTSQKVAVFSLDFTLLRILVAVWFLRFILRPEERVIRWQRMDSILVAWVVSGFLVSIIRTGGASVVYQLGQAFDDFGLYFLFRYLVRDWEDVARLAKIVAILSLPIMLAMIIESHTRHNLFSMFGGVPEITAEREGRLRCQGPYSHPILAGVFWAILLPIAASQFWAQRQRWLGVAGVASGLVIVYLSASSTPLLGVVAALVGAFMFYIRHNLRFIRIGLVTILIGLQLTMQWPVWSLIARISAVGGSTSWYRYFLIDQFVNRFSEWAMLGINSTAQWGMGLFDLTNQYVAEGVNGGLLKLLFFVWFLKLTFTSVGQIWRQVERDRVKLALIWSLGVAMLTQAVSFIGVSIFGQNILLLFMIPAIICSLSELTTDT